MENFVRIIMEKSDFKNKLDESIFPKQKVYNTPLESTIIDIPLPRTLSEDESNEYAGKLANCLFEMGYNDFDIEISSNEHDIEEETYEGDDFFESYGNNVV